MTSPIPLAHRISGFSRACVLIASWLVTSGTAFAGPDIDPALRKMLRDAPTAGSKGPLRSLSDPASTAYDVFLDCEGGAGPPSIPGLETVPLGDDLYAARGDLAHLRALIGSEAVRYVRLSRPVRPTLDRSTAYIGVNGLRRANLDTGRFTGQTGAGVAVGIVDTGIDWLHPDFRKPEGGTRVDRYWDQLAYGARPPVGFPYGVEYSAHAIDLGLAGGIDNIGHGTHVLGIAAGNGRGSFQPGIGLPYAGMAPEATLLVVRTNFTEIGAVLGCRYIMARADALDIPVVINLSLGNHFGPHRGTTPFESGLTHLVEAGRLIVAAAGNDGDRPLHAEVHPGAGSAALSIDFPAYPKGTSPFLAVEGWFSRSDRYRFVIRNPLGDVVGTIDFGNEDAEFVDVKGLVRGWHTEDLGMGTLYLEISDNGRSQRLATGTWRIEIEPLRPSSPTSEIDFWLANWGGLPAGAAPVFSSHVDAEETLISPATAPHILAVGALATRACWQDSQDEEVCYATPPPLEEVAFFSSRGPTPDGRVKPEILAPGFGVVSARSSGILSIVASREELDRLSVPNGLYYVSQGTSMAAPHATGTVALLLARYPELTFEQAEHRLVARARPIQDWRTHESVLALQAGAALAPVVDVSLSELVPEEGGFRLRWFAARERSPVRYRVYRSFQTTGPFTLLAANRIAGSNPFEILDTHVEPGRTHIYQVKAVETETGLEDDLLTHTGLWKGALVPAFRPPDPNPARRPMSFRYFVPDGGSAARLDIAVFDAAGRRIKELEPTPLNPDGEGMAVWDLRDERGHRVGGGIYFARLDLVAPGQSRRFVQRFVVLP